MTNITVDVSVEEVLTALGLTTVPKGCALAMDARVEVRAFADEGDLCSEFPDDDDLSRNLDQTTVMELFAAIRHGDVEGAEALLDRLFNGDLRIREWGQQACHLARAA